jgi:hypothetical protein
MTTKRFPSTWRSASRWLGANCFCVLSSHQATARAKSISGRTELRRDSRAIRCAISLSAHTKWGKKTKPPLPTDSKVRSPFASIPASACSTMSGSTSRSWLVFASRSARGRPQWPACVASSKTCSVPAQARYFESRGIPNFSATVSDVLNPIPRMSSASRYGLWRIFSMASAP